MGGVGGFHNRGTDPIRWSGRSGVMPPGYARAEDFGRRFLTKVRATVGESIAARLEQMNDSATDIRSRSR